MERLVEVVQRRAHERAQRFVGRTLDVLVEGPSRTDASRIRGRSRHNKAVNFAGLAAPGEIVPVEIHSATSTTLAGEESLLSRAAAYGARSPVDDQEQAPRRTWRSSASAPSARRSPRPCSRAGGRQLCSARAGRSSEVVVELPDGSVVTVDAPAADRSGVLDGPADWVLLAVKAHQTAGAAGWLSALCGPRSTVAVLQNGIDHVERVGPLVGDADVLPVVNWCPVEPVAPGRVRQRDALRLAVPAGRRGRGSRRCSARSPTSPSAAPSSARRGASCAPTRCRA